MKIPNKIKILGKDINIKFDKELMNSSSNKGEAHYRYNKIILQSNTNSIPLKQQQIDETLLHEIIHFILIMTALSDNFENEKEEQFVKLFSEVLYQVLKDNKLKF